MRFRGLFGRRHSARRLGRERLEALGMAWAPGANGNLLIGLSVVAAVEKRFQPPAATSFGSLSWSAQTSANQQPGDCWRLGLAALSRMSALPSVLGGSARGPRCLGQGSFMTRGPQAKEFRPRVAISPPSMIWNGRKALATRSTGVSIAARSGQCSGVSLSSRPVSPRARGRAPTFELSLGRGCRRSARPRCWATVRFPLPCASHRYVATNRAPGWHDRACRVGRRWSCSA